MCRAEQVLTLRMADRSLYDTKKDIRVANLHAQHPVKNDAPVASHDRSRLPADQLQHFVLDAIDAIPSGFALFDAEDRVVVVNRVFREMVPTSADMIAAGASFAEMARHNAVEVFGVPQDALEEWMERRLAYRETPNGVFDQKLKDGRWLRIQESRTSEGGTATNWTDITDLKIQEQVAENYADALMTTNQQLEEFAHVASHDLQEPLRKIEVFGGRLSEKAAGQLEGSSVRYLERILDATRRMRKLINDLLDFSKIGDQRASFEKVDLNAVLQGALSDLDLRIQEHRATVTVADLPIINGDFAQLSRLFQNLISNAIKYVAPDVTPEITVEIAAQDASRVEIAVRDNGIGFDQKDASRIFEAFQRLHGRNGGYEGTGIGLASCQKIADQHDGSIRAESAPGAGSTFIVTFHTLEAALPE